MKLIVVLAIVAAVVIGWRATTTHRAADCPAGYGSGLRCLNNK